MVANALETHSVQAVDQLRCMEVERLDMIQLAAWQKAMDGDVPSAIAAVRCIMSRCHLLGLEGSSAPSVTYGKAQNPGRPAGALRPMPRCLPCGACPRGVGASGRGLLRSRPSAVSGNSRWHRKSSTNLRCKDTCPKSLGQEANDHREIVGVHRR